MFEEINFKSGVVEYLEFNINENLSFEEQQDEFKEDMLQVVYHKTLIIDIGWYPAHKKNGTYIISLIQNYKWDNPVMENKCNNIQELKHLLQEYINYAEKLK